MKFNWLNKKAAYGVLIMTAAMFASCSDTDVAEETGNPEGPTEATTDGSSNLTTVQFATFAGNPDRVTYAATRAEGDEEAKTLQLIASIANPSKDDGFNFIKEEENGRWMSATSIYYDASTTPGTYYATYHMQGNNYNTKLENEIGGAIQTFKIVDEEENGVKIKKVELGNGFRAADPNKEDFDFNHLYFDVTDKRIIAVGHKWNVPSTWTGDAAYTGKRDNTRAIIGVFEPNERKFDYATISTSEKEYDERGKSLGYKDAGDANCVIRAGETQNRNHTSGWNFYYVATRKGMAVVRAEEDHLFEPVLRGDGINYFIPTPGSAKYVAKTGTSSYFKLLYLAEDKENKAYTTSSTAKIAQFATQTGDNNTFAWLQTPNSPFTHFDPSSNIINFPEQIDLPQVVSPIDGKNVMLVNPGSNSNNDNIYAALGTSGMYYKFNGVSSHEVYEGALKFKGTNNYLPVNCIAADVSDQEHGHEGFIYVACGARLVILHRTTFELVAYWNIPTKDKDGEYLDDVAASANYIHVEKAPANSDWSPRERTITVAFGQEGVKVFKFNPATLEPMTVREKELPAEIVCK